MLLLRKPSTETLRQFLDVQSRLPFSYEPVGATAAAPPPGFVVDRTRIKLGQGEQAYQTAANALRQWTQFRLSWLEAWPSDTPIVPGETVAVLARVTCFWWLNACRIVYVVVDDGPVSRFGFAYGTLPDHAALGEERFLVEWDRADDSVWFDILAFSRPRHFLARVAYPGMRIWQKRFAQQAGAAMERALESRL